MSNLPAYFISSKIDAICKKIEHKQHTCQICETITHHSEVASYCFQCAIAVCEECKSKHDRRHKNHAQIKVSANTISNVVCPEHDKYLEAFCIDCSRAVCGACSISTHEEHTLKDVGSSEDRTDELDQLFDDHIASAEKQLAKLATIQDDFNGHIDTLLDVSLKEPYRLAFVPNGIVSLGSIVEEGNQSSTSQCLILDGTTTQTKETMSDETTTKPHTIIAGTTTVILEGTKAKRRFRFAKKSSKPEATGAGNETTSSDYATVSKIMIHVQEHPMSDIYTLYPLFD